MKLQDICIGDWFRYRYTDRLTGEKVVITFTVTRIENELGRYYVWGEGEDENGKKHSGRMCYPEQLEPIQLTEQFFIEKGYKKVGHKYYELEYGNLALSAYSAFGDGSSYWCINHRILYDNDQTPSQQMIISSVHQYQHLMNAWEVVL